MKTEDTTVKRILVCGFGDPYRRGGGIEQAAVNEIREQLEQAPLSSGGFDLERFVDAIVVNQLAPEMAEIVVDYDLVIFVNAQVAARSELLYEECIAPTHQSTNRASHQTQPATVLELTRRTYGYAPQGVTLSLRGHDFDSNKGLSLATVTLVSLAVERILSWAQAFPHKHNHLLSIQKDRPSTRCQPPSPKVY